jgi:hypothetical protein
MDLKEIRIEGLNRIPVTKNNTQQWLLISTVPLYFGVSRNQQNMWSSLYRTDFSRRNQLHVVVHVDRETAATNGCFVLLQIIYEYGELPLNDICREKPMNSEKASPSATSSTTNPTYTVG